MDRTCQVAAVRSAPDGRVDVAIIGAGIMGAMLAETLARSGRSVAAVDRRPPASDSTAASPALVMWEIDTPLTHLARDVGLDEAGARWRRVYDVVARLHPGVGEVDSDAPKCPTVYLAGSLLDADALQDEAAARRRFGLPSDWLDADAIAERFGIAPRVGLVSDGGFAVDPVALACGLLKRARANGATVIRAASSISVGIDRQYCRIRKIPKMPASHGTSTPA